MAGLLGIKYGFFRSTAGSKILQNSNGKEESKSVEKKSLEKVKTAFIEETKKQVIYSDEFSGEGWHQRR